MASNRYPGVCSKCGTNVPSGEGVLGKVDGRWITAHAHGKCAGYMDFSIPDVTSVEVEGAATAELFAHQAAVIAAVQAGRRQILLADEPGLGKTATALISLAAAGSKRAVIVVLAVVKINWAREAARWLPGSAVQILSGRKAGPIDPAATIIIVNYDIVGSWTTTLIGDRFDGLILDDAHMVKDSRSARGKAVASLAESLPSTALRMALTGTPVPNRPIDLAHPLDLLGLLETEFGGFWAFAKRYADAYQGEYGWDLTGAANLDELHERLLAVGMVRRRKSDVLDLPSRTVVDVPVELAGEGARSVKAAEKALVAKLVDLVRERVAASSSDTPVVIDADFVGGVVRRALAAGGDAAGHLATLRSELGTAKAPLVEAQVRDLLESGGSVVVMVHHRAVQATLADSLTEAGVIRITGGQSAEDRQAAIDKFQARDAKVAVCSIMAAGVGITLHAASQVVIGELPWTAAAQDQAIDRVHRIGQDEPVTAWRIIAAGTLDERMAQVISAKASIALAAIDGGNLAVGDEVVSAAEVLTDLVLAAMVPRRRNTASK